MLIDVRGLRRLMSVALAEFSQQLLCLSFTTCRPNHATPAPRHPATGLGVCASCLSCLLVLISPFYEHRSYRTATAETRVLEDKTLIGAMVEVDENVEDLQVIDELGWDCRGGEVAGVGCSVNDIT